MNVTLPKPMMMAVALVQGICLFLLYQAIELNRWPANDSMWLFVFASSLTFIPVFFLLLIDQKNLLKALKCLLPYTAIILGVSAYSGLQLTPTEFVKNQVIIFPFILTMAIASFKALMYAQEYSSGAKLDYQSLFHHSWRNFLVMGLSLLFTLLFFGILFLWGALFNIIEIDFFKNIFSEEWFLFPAGSLAFAFAIIIFRSLVTIIDSISALLRALIKFLLPLLSAIALIFLFALLVQGFSPLWQTQLGSALILWLQALILFSVNAVYQGNSKEHPYPLIIHRVVYLGVSILPSYSLIALYGLFTRIEQYGLTVQRCWAVFVALLLFFFTLGYLWGIIRKNDNWLETLARVNVRMGVLILAMLILINSPVANFQKLSSQNQLERLYSGNVAADSLDINYFRFSLGRQGYLALEKVKEIYGADNPELVARIDASYRNEFISMATPLPSEPTMTLDELKTVLEVWPTGTFVPDEVLVGMLDIGNSVYPGFGPFVTGGSAMGQNPTGTMGPMPIFARPSPDDKFYAFIIEMNELNELNAANNNTAEIIFVRETTQGFKSFYLWALVEGEWQSLPLINIGQTQNLDLSEIMQQNQVNVVPKDWNDVQIGGLRLSVPQRSNSFGLP